ncbi:MAG: hypothetical protein ABR552_03675, partial [Actinomycetota bacterium]
MDLSQIEWLEPWSGVADPAMRARLEAELVRELGRGHILFQRLAKALARRLDQDDVLYAVESPSEVAVVHLSYAAKPDQPPWPSTTLFDNLTAFIETRMKPDHDE